MILPEQVTIIVQDGNRVVYHTPCKEKFNEFYKDGRVCLPDRYMVAADKFIREKEGKALDMCSSAMIIMHMHDTEIKYYCEDLSEETLIWEQG